MKRDAANQLRGARWSSAVRCPRMGAYTALGAIPAIPSEQVEGLFQRGHDVEDRYFARLAEQYTGRIIREAAIQWGDGWSLHVDAILPDADGRPHVEVKANRDVYHVPGADLTIGGVTTKAPVLQVAGAAVFDPEGGAAEVVVVSPLDYTERRYPVDVTSDVRGAVEEIAALVVHAVQTGELPPRVCRVPSDGIGRFCPYVDTCFADWQPVDPDDVPAEVGLLAQQVYDADQAAKLAEAASADAKQQRDDLRRQLADYLAAGVQYEVAGLRVKRTTVKGRQSFNLKDAVATGAIDPRDVEAGGRLEPFVKTGDGHDRWTIREDEGLVG